MVRIRSGQERWARSPMGKRFSAGETPLPLCRFTPSWARHWAGKSRHNPACLPVFGLVDRGLISRGTAPGRGPYGKKTDCFLRSVRSVVDLRSAWAYGARMGTSAVSGRSAASGSADPRSSPAASAASGPESTQAHFQRLLPRLDLSVRAGFFLGAPHPANSLGASCRIRLRTDSCRIWLERQTASLLGATTGYTGRRPPAQRR
jgi:hypothetical protein